MDGTGSNVKTLSDLKFEQEYLDRKAQQESRSGDVGEGPMVIGSGGTVGVVTDGTELDRVECVGTGESGGVLRLRMEEEGSPVIEAPWSRNTRAGQVLGEGHLIGMQHWIRC